MGRNHHALLRPVRGTMSGRRFFGTRHRADKLKLRGIVRRAFRESETPKLPVKATDHFLQVLRQHGQKEAIKRVAEARIEAQRKDQNKSIVLTSEEKTRLLWRYVPDEMEAVKTLRKETHKWLWRFLKRKDWRRMDACLEQLRDRQIPFDEITYNMSIFGMLLHPRKDDELAKEVLAEMVAEQRFHPSLLRIQTNFVESYFELKEVDAQPNPWNLLKVVRTFWTISVSFKRRRVKETRQRLAQAAMEQRRQLMQERGELDGSQLPLQIDMPDYESDGEISDGEGKPRVKFPAKRPYQLKGVHKGSGVPNRRKHRWKH